MSYFTARMHQKLWSVAAWCIYYCPCSSDRLYCFHLSYFFSVHKITHEPLHLVSWNFAWTCPLTITQNPENFKFKGQGHRTGFSDSLPLRDRPKKFVDTITHELLHSAWWSFAWTYTSTTSRTLLDFKVIGQRSRSRVFFCVRDGAATRVQYLALSKACWSGFSLLWASIRMVCSAGRSTPCGWWRSWKMRRGHLLGTTNHRGPNIRWLRRTLTVELSRRASSLKISDNL